MDNFFLNCPPMMDDKGRQFTDYQTSTRKNEYIKYINDIWRDDQYRLFLQLNGKNIMDREWIYNKKNNSCWVNDCIHKYPTRQEPKDFAQEREAFNSIFNLNIKKQYTPMRTCKKYNDYRLNP